MQARMRDRIVLLWAISVLVPAGAAGEVRINEKLHLSGTLRVQWSDTEGREGRDGFETRLARLVADFQMNAHISGRISVELASGERAQNSDLLDAYARWQLNPRTIVSLGQQLMPAFYDLRTSLPQHDALELPTVVNTYFRGRRGRGVYVEHQLNSQSRALIGVWNSLTIRDPQLNERGGEARMMALLAVRRDHEQVRFNIGALWGRRPGFLSRIAPNNLINVPEVDRRVLYGEVEIHPAGLRPLTLRWTSLAGRDRNPAGGLSNPQFLSPSNYTAQIGYVIYNLRSNHRLTLRWEEFDPDTARRNDSVRVLGIFLHFFPEPGVRLTAGYEWVDASEGRNRAYFAAQFQF